MRIADKMSFEQVNQNLSKNRSEMAKLQNQAATQKRVTQPSDDPIAAARVLASRVELAGTNQYIKNLDFAKSYLNFTDQSLGELTEQLVRAKELALGQASDGGSNEQSRAVVATEVEQLYNQIVQIGNRQYGDRYIFSGYKTQTQPFDIKGDYSGDQGEMMIHVDKGSFLSMNIPGSKVFLGKGLSADGISHSSVEQAKTIEELKAQLAENTNTPQELNPNKKTDDVKNDQTDLNQREPSSLRTTISPNEKMSNDSQIEGDENNVIKNTSKVESDDSLQSMGVNVFKVLDNFVTSLKADDKQGVQDVLESLDTAISQIVMARSQVGSRVMALTNAMETLQKSKVDNNTFISQLEDADAFEVVSNINKAESALQATLATSGKLIQPSLLDFLR